VNLTLEQYLALMVEKYLFGDLKLMQQHAIGFPPLMASFAGIELLGGLMSPTKFETGSKFGRTYFVEYWSTVLYPKSDARFPKSDDVAHQVYTLVRNGLAHCFLPKGPIGVGEVEPGNHLKRDAATDWLIIDPKQLSADFMDSYYSRFSPQLAQPGRVAEIRKRFQDMVTAYDSAFDVAAVRALFPVSTAKQTTPSLTTTHAPVSRSQGPTGPI
jgi:hypothetical protein